MTDPTCTCTAHTKSVVSWFEINACRGLGVDVGVYRWDPGGYSDRVSGHYTNVTSSSVRRLCRVLPTLPCKEPSHETHTV